MNRGLWQYPATPPDNRIVSSRRLQIGSGACYFCFLEDDTGRICKMAERVITRLGQRIRMLREDRSWSLTDLQRMSGVERSYIAKVERGEHEVCLVNLARLAKAFEMDLSDLLEGI